MLMKKVLYVLTAMLMVAVACKKGETPDPTPGPGPEPEPQPEAASLTLVTPAIVDLDAESGIYTIKFTTNKDWTATVDAEDGTVVLGATSGKQGENIELKVTYQNVPEGGMGRVFNVVIKAGDKTAEVAFFQGLVFAYMADTDAVSVSGGKVEYLVITNLEYTIKKYDGAEEAFPWAPVTIAEESHKVKITFDVAANPGYDQRSAYVKFTVPAIQVPVIDEETGDPTGETEDYVERLYVYQEGNAKEAWNISLPSSFDVTNIETEEAIHFPTASIALFQDMVLVSDGTTLYAFNKENGAPANIVVPEGLPVQSITNDDAGNVLFANEAHTGEIVEIYAVKGSDTNLNGFVKIAEAGNGVWCAATADCVKAKGNVFGNAVISVLIGGGSGFGNPSYAMVWQVTNGEADGSKYIVGPTDYDDTIWVSNRASFAPAGDTDAAGYYYCGYDGVYALQYYNGEWSHAIEELGDWSMAPNAIASTIWNGKNIVAVVSMAYWGLDWGMPSILHVFNVSDGEVLATTSYVSDGVDNISGGQEASTTDVVLKVEGNDLAAYVVDSDWGMLMKVKYPKL